MRFKIKANFTKEDIEKDVKAFIERTGRVMIYTLQDVGNQFVTDAREKDRATGGFDDQTGNLRSSIGYIILHDGQEVDSNFTGSSTEGVAAGMRHARDLGLDSTKGFVLITVAGMEYASFVEAKGYDVITGSTLGAKKKLKNAFDMVKKAMQ